MKEIPEFLVFNTTHPESYLLKDLRKKNEAVSFAKFEGKGLLYRSQKVNLPFEIIRNTRTLSGSLEIFLDDGNNSNIRTYSELSKAEKLGFWSYHYKVYRKTHEVNPVANFDIEKWEAIVKDEYFLPDLSSVFYDNGNISGVLISYKSNEANSIEIGYLYAEKIDVLKILLNNLALKANTIGVESFKDFEVDDTYPLLWDLFKKENVKDSEEVLITYRIL
ncbi:hypothetical protein BG262_01080 [Floricoccus penangensis]|uniref:Uncharacterized protein n=1 Tax=Floricoccus penangensis TaxID=1859475 RepID=A0A9Q5JGX9_9LACT|nr:hypothetical protein [Floricoccus penangensis]OFI47248.1 hypothetical protein BG262_01080 [Floricoccus penangensis]